MSDFMRRLREPSPLAPGTRIRLLEMANEDNPIPVGTTGTVDHGNGAQVWVKWDIENRYGLALLPDIDKWEVIEETEIDK